MIDFYNLLNNIQIRNQEQRNMLVQTMLPFFNAISEQKAYEKQLKRSEEEAKSKAVKFNQSMGTAYKSMGMTPPSIAPDTSIEAQELIFNQAWAEEQRKRGLIDKAQQLGFGAQFDEARKANPNEDVDVTYSRMLNLLSDKEVDEKAQSLGSRGYSLYQQKVGSGTPARVALADALKQINDEEMAMAMRRSGGGGSSGGGSGSAGGAEKPEHATFSEYRSASGLVSKLKGEAIAYNKGKSYKVGEKNYFVKVNGYEYKREGKITTHSFARYDEGKNTYYWDGTRFYKQNADKTITVVDPPAKGAAAAMQQAYSEWSSVASQLKDAENVLSYASDKFAWVEDNYDPDYADLME